MFSAPSLTHLWPLAVAASVLGGSAASAAEASPWHEDVQSSARLIAAPTRLENGVRLWRAGVEIKLKEGWKTYWRYPGDSGVPPSFDFSKSQNVRTLTVLYPAPSRFPDGAGGSSIGYKGDVVLPVHVVAQDAAKPVVLRLKLDYAVCEKLCVPAEAALELELADTSDAKGDAVAAAEAQVPRPATIGEGGLPSIRAVHREPGKDKPRIVVDVASASGAPVALFAEGPNPQWALPLPEPVAGAPAGLQRFAFDLDGVPPGEKTEGANLRLTAVSGAKAVEVAFRLD